MKVYPTKKIKAVADFDEPELTATEKYTKAIAIMVCIASTIFFCVKILFL